MLSLAGLALIAVGATGALYFIGDLPFTVPLMSRVPEKHGFKALIASLAVLGIGGVVFVASLF